MSRAPVQRAAFAALVLLALPVAAQQAWPERPIRLLVPVAAGGGTDVIARILAQGLNESWGQSVVVDNRGGGGGVIGVTVVAKSPPDGYTMLLASNAHVSFLPALHARLPYDPQKDLAAVSLVAQQPFVVTIHPSLPATTLKEMLALARGRPGTISYASGGSGGAAHLGTELLQLTAGVSLLHVPYKGTGPGMSALLAGEVQVLIAGVATVLPHVKNGRVRALAVTGGRRSAVMPEVPTVAEAGVAGYEFDVWYGLMFPSGTPRALIARAAAEVARLGKSPATAERFGAAGLEPVASSPEAFAGLIARELPKWRDVVRRANIRVE